jgi:hypothetical protein
MTGGRLWIAAVVAVWIAACTTPLPSVGASTSGHVELQTLPPESGQTPAACMAALMTATLVRHPRSGAGLADTDGHVVAVIWPFGYFARDDGGRLAVVAGSGKVLAHEGDLVSVGGGFAGDDESTWTGCGGITAVLPPAPS